MENRKYYWIAAAFTLIIYSLGVLSYLLSSKIESLGTLGDFIGGSLNPILSFLTFLILIKTIKYQKDALDTSSKELSLTREELELTRAEVKRSADAQEKSKEVQKEQAKTQLLQQFENTFFSLIEQIKSSRPNKEDIEVLTNLSCRPKNQNILNARGVFQGHREKHSHFFRLIYQTLKFLDSKKSSNEIDTVFYKNILRSLLTPNETILLAINSSIIPRFIGKDTHEKYKILIENYSMLQHMPFRAPLSDSNNYLNNSFILTQILGCYSLAAFEDNIYLQRLIKEDSNIEEKMKSFVRDL